MVAPKHVCDGAAGEGVVALADEHGEQEAPLPTGDRRGVAESARVLDAHRVGDEDPQPGVGCRSGCLQGFSKVVVVHGSYLGFRGGRLT